MTAAPPPRPPGRAGRLLALLLGATAAGLLAAQPPAPAPQDGRELTTPDGSRFVLLPDAGPLAVPVLHWTIAVPCGPQEDPTGLEGMARATVRASLNGTIEYGSRDWGLEESALDTLDRWDREIEVRLANGEPIPDGARSKQRDAANNAAGLADPGAWRRAAGDVPAIPRPLVESDAATLLTITVAPKDLERLARLLLDWREHAVLRDVRDELMSVRDELRRLQLDPQRALRREVLGLAYLGSPGARTIDPFPNSYSREDALGVWQSVVHPRRIRHVLTGGFDADAVRRVLDAVFVRTDLPPVTRQSTPALAPGLRRKSEVPTDGLQGVAIACAVPPGCDPTTLEITLRWLAGGPGARLDAGLRARGLRGLQLGYENPFPDRADAGLVLIEALAPGAATLAPSTPGLLDALTQQLDKAVAEGPRKWELERAIRAIESELAAERADPLQLGRRVAIDWGMRERPLRDALGEPAPPDLEVVRALAAKLWNEMPRSTAHLTRTP